MKPQAKDIKTQIINHLKSCTDATAEQIAKALGMKDSPEPINNALNALRTEAVVEAKVIKGRGKANWYWLAGAVHDDEPMPEADPKLLATANRELSNRIQTLLKAIGCTDESGDGILTAAVMAETRRINATNADIDRKTAQHALKNAEAANALLNEALKKAESQRNNWRDTATLYHAETPIELVNYVSGLQNRIKELEAKAAIPDAPKPVQKKAQTPRKPFTVTGLNGYHAGGEKVTLFLDRRLNARSVTLTAEKLNQLANMARVA